MLGMFTSAAARSAGGWMGARAVAGGLAGAVIGGDDSSMFKGALLGAMGPGLGSFGRGAAGGVGKLAQGGIPLLSGMAKSGHMGGRILGAGLLGGLAKATYDISHSDNIRQYQESKYGMGAATDARLAGTRMAGTAGAMLLGAGAVGIGLGMYKGPLNMVKGGANAIGGISGAAGRGLGAVGRGLGKLRSGDGRYGRPGIGSLRQGARDYSAGFHGYQTGALSGEFDKFSRAYGMGAATRALPGAARKAGVNAFSTLSKATERSTGAMEGATWSGPRRIALRAKGFAQGLRGEGPISFGVNNQALDAGMGRNNKWIRNQWSGSAKGGGAFRDKARSKGLGARKVQAGAVRPDLEMGYGFGLQARGAVINAGIKGGEIAQGLTNHAQRWKYGVTQAAGRAVGGIGPAVGNMGGSAVSGGKSILGTPGNVGQIGRAGPEILPSGLRGSHFNPERSPLLYSAAGGVAAGLMLGGTDAARRKRGKNMPEGFITAMNSAPRGGIHPALNFATQGLTLRTHNRRKRRVLD